MIVEIPLLPEIITPSTITMQYSFSYPTETGNERFTAYNGQIVDIPTITSPNILVETVMTSQQETRYSIRYFNADYDLSIYVPSYSLAKLYFIYLKEGKDFLVDEIREKYPEEFL